MKKILLTQGQVALVDDRDYEYLNQWKWYAVKGRNTLYAVRKSRKSEDGLPVVIIMMHRVVLERHNLLKPGHDTDHRDGNGLNNQKYNLRSVTKRQNSQNRANGHTASSQFPGVCWNKRDKNWKSQSRIDGKQKHLGYFEKEEDAALAYIVALKQIGETILK